MTFYELHRKHITGPIREDTPGCVILEIGQSLRIQVDWNQVGVGSHINAVINSISTIREESVKEAEYPPHDHGFSEDKLGHIAQFVNGNHDIVWRYKTLIVAFRHLCKYYKTAVPQLPDVPFIIGQKTMSTPLAYDACMLYRICVYHGVKTTRMTTVEQMGQAVKGLHQTCDSLHLQIMTTLKTLSKVALINLIMSTEMRVAPSPNIKHVKAQDVALLVETLPLPSDCKSETRVMPSAGELNQNQMTLAYKRLTNVQHILPRIDPMSQEEAVMMAAIVYGINLVECPNPYNEFMVMKRDSLSGTADNLYVPVDKIFHERYMTNRDWFNVRKTWTPHIPNIYTGEQLHKFAFAEGYTTDEVGTRTAGELLHLARITPTFYLGRHPDCKAKRTTVDQDDVLNVRPELLITYGIADPGDAKLRDKHPFYLYKISELSDCFQNSKDYTDPARPSEQLSVVAITKLKNISREKLCQLKKTPQPAIKRYSAVSRQSSPETEIETEYKRLIEVMNQVEKLNVANSRQALQLGQFYKRGDEKTKASISDCLTGLLHMSYYMRGWKINGKKNLPIHKDDTTFPSDQQGQVDLNVTNEIKNFDRCVGDLADDIKVLFRRLPLIGAKSRASEVVFSPSISNDQGITIIDRLNIVKTGTSTYSCIRMSSNWLCASAYYYMLACGMAPPFDIKILVLNGLIT